MPAAGRKAGWPGGLGTDVGEALGDGWATRGSPILANEGKRAAQSDAGTASAGGRHSGKHQRSAERGAPFTQASGAVPAHPRMAESESGGYPRLTRQVDIATGDQLIVSRDPAQDRIIGRAFGLALLVERDALVDALRNLAAGGLPVGEVHRHTVCGKR